MFKKVGAMGELFLKALRWALFVAFIIGGIAAFNYLEKYGMKTGFLAVCSFGGAYLMSGPWRKLPPKAMVLSILLVAVLAWLADKLPNMYYNFTGNIVYDNFYIVWLGLVFMLGVPAMMWIFKRFPADD
jgi:hypothetical protein